MVQNPPWPKAYWLLGAGGTLLLAATAFTVGSGLPAWGWPLIAALPWIGAHVWERRRRDAMAEGQANEDDLVEMEHAVSELISHVDGHLASVVGQMRGDLQQVQDLVADAVATLQQAFNGLNDRSTQQSQLVGEIIMSMREQGGDNTEGGGFAE